MENFPQHCYDVFMTAIHHYHQEDSVDAVLQDPYDGALPDSLFYRKCWIDTVQWHLEDIIRDPDIDSAQGLAIKRRIDSLNQKRTDIVEVIDDYFQEMYRHVVAEANARHNTESLGWAFDRLSILALKEYHLEVELNRAGAAAEHISNCLSRRAVLTNQKSDLLGSIGWLLEDIRVGRKINKVYRQLKMYNDQAFNPVLYSKSMNIKPAEI